jgi:phage-related protein
MAGSYHAGTGLVDVLPSLKGFHSRIRRELKGAGVDFGVDVSPNMRGFNQKLRAGIGKTPTLDMRVDVNRSALKRAEADVAAAEKRISAARDRSSDAAAQADIAEKSLAETRAKSSSKASQIAAAELKLAQAKRVSAAASNDLGSAESALRASRRAVSDAKMKIRPDIDTSTMAGKLHAFADRASRQYAIRLGVDADTSAARMHLAIFSAVAQKNLRFTANVSLDTGAAVGKLALLSSVGSAAGIGIAGGMGIAGSAIAAIPGLAAGAAGPIAALVVGLQGVGGALKAFTDADNQAAANATSNARQQTSAARAIATAQSQLQQAKVSVSRAYEDASSAQTAALQRERDAERQVIDAEKARLKAQQDLTRAVEDARRAQQELNFQVEGGAIAERQAVLDLADAQAALSAAQASGVSGAALERVQIAYDQQALSLKEVRAQNNNLAQDKAVSDAAGINGSAQVVAAQDQVAQSARSVQDAQDGVRQAQQASAQQQIQAQRSVADAQAAVVQAQQQVANAIADAGTVGAASIDKINAALDKLSPNAREFVTEFQALKPMLEGVKNTVQDALFAGMGADFSAFATTVLPEVATNLGVVATAMNGATREFMAFLASAPVMASIKDLFALIGQLVTALQPVIQTFVQLFLQLATAAMPGIIAIVQAFGTVATAIMTAFQPLIDNGTLNLALGSLAGLITALGPILGTILGLAVQLMAALGPSLISIVTSLTPVIQILADVLLMMAPYIGQIVQLIASALLPAFQALQPVIAALMPVLVSLVDSALKVLVPLLQLAAEIFLALMPAITGVSDVIAALVPVIMPLISNLIKGLLPVIQALTPVIVALAQAIAQNLVILLGTLITVVLQLVSALAPMLPVLVSIATQLITSLLPVLPVLAEVFLTLVAAVLPLLPPLLNLAATLFPVIIDLVNTLMPVILLLAQMLTGVLAVVLQTIIIPILMAVVGVIKTLIDIFGFLWDSAVKPAVDAITGAIRWAWDNVLQPIFTWIGDRARDVGDAFKAMGDTIGGIWDGIKRLVHDGIQGVIDFFWNDGLRPVVNAVLKWVPGVDELPEYNLPAFAAGGVVPGFAPGKDVVPSLLSPGEAVLVPELVRLIGPELILRANAAAMAGRAFSRGGIVSRFADGGVVGSSTPATPTTVGAVTIDPASLTGISDAATVAVEAITTLIAANTALMASFQQLQAATAVSWLSIQTSIVGAEEVINSRQILLQQQMAASWIAISLAVQQSQYAQENAFTGLSDGMAGIRTAMTATADWAVVQYGRMRAAAADPIRWVLEQPVNAGLINAWNLLDSQFAFGRHVNPVPIGFATGGLINGAGTGTSDSIPAVLPNGVPLRVSNHEFVVRERITRKALPFLQALNAGQPEAMQAAGVRGYATGGLIANTGSQLAATVAKGQAFLKSQAGKPYVWGGVGPNGYDCSGLVSALANYLRGEANPYRRLGVAASQPWPGFVPGLNSAFASGYNSHHTALTLGGLNGEAQTFGVPVLVGGRAAGADSGQFTGHASLPIGGSFIPGGGPGFNPIDIMTAAFADTLKSVNTVADMWPGNRMGTDAAGITRSAVSGVTKFGVDKLTALTAASSAIAGSPEVIAAVRAVAGSYGWGDGPQWNALASLITGESGFNPAARNPTSSAAGLFQKMTSLHGPLEQDIAGQTRWGLNYIRGAYGNPVNAYGKWLSRSPHWYDQGGIANGVGFLAKNTLEPERVLSPVETRSFDRLVSHISSGDFTASLEGNDGPLIARIEGKLDVGGVMADLVDARIEIADHATGDALSRGSRI